MRTIQLDCAALTAWVDRLVAARRVYGVQAKADRFVFGPLSQAADLRLDYDVTILPPKKFFQPPCETLATYEGAAEFKSVFESEPFILFGVHPYDLVALGQMDAVFAAGNADEHYRRRRAAATLVAVDVQTASPHNFSGCMEAATATAGWDALLTRIGDEYVVESSSAKGDQLLAAAPAALAADAVALGRRAQVWDDNRRLLRRHALKAPVRELPALLDQNYDHPVWKERADRCFSCGSCTMVCPTCYCFDVQDRSDWSLARGTRDRLWDGCQMKDFAAVAGAHNFRKNRVDRFRHRYYRKGKYLWDRMGQIACVGCGRCISACVSAVAHPVDVFNRLMER